MESLASIEPIRKRPYRPQLNRYFSRKPKDPSENIFRYIDLILNADVECAIRMADRLDNYYGDLSETYAVCLGHSLMEAQGDV